MKNKAYGYTLYFNDGSKVRGSISAVNEEIASKTLKGIQKVRENVQFSTLDSLDFPCDYDWDKKLQLWQSKLL